MQACAPAAAAAGAAHTAYVLPALWWCVQEAAAAIVACIDGHVVLDPGVCVPDEETTAVFAKLCAAAAAAAAVLLLLPLPLRVGIDRRSTEKRGGSLG